jgi:hypothetical protein
MTNDNLLLIKAKDFWDEINKRHQQKGGVYKLIAVKDGKRIPVNRFLGTDNDGILYIGKAISFLDRVIDLKKSIAPEFYGSGHDCGRRYKSDPGIPKQFPYDNLYIELSPTDNPKELEAALLEAYLKAFGELPPFNAVI